jgi:hypothetical protein
VVATAALPILMMRSRHPLIPPELFRSRNFTVTNISTLLIYGALYVSSYYLALFQQGTLGYTAAAAGAGGIPGSLFLIFFSRRFGSLAARFGPRVARARDHGSRRALVCESTQHQHAMEAPTG